MSIIRDHFWKCTVIEEEQAMNEEQVEPEQLEPHLISGEDTEDCIMVVYMLPLN